MSRTQNHPLTAKHLETVVKTPFRKKNATVPLWGVTFRPGDKTGSFLGKLYRPIGAAALVMQAAEPVFEGRQVVHLMGYKAQMDAKNGTVVYDETGRVFDYNFGLRPFPGARGRILDPVRNPTLVQLGLEMYALRMRYATQSLRADTAPRLPGVFLGFGPGRLPAMEDSTALRQRIADHMQVSRKYLDHMDEGDRQNLMLAEWPTLFVQQGDRENNTGHVLISNQFCTKWQSSLRVYESFEGLLGAEIFNPMRQLVRTSVKSPTRRVAEELKLDLAQAGEWDQTAVDNMEKKMRQALGPVQALIETHSIHEAMVNPDNDITVSHLDPLAKLGEEETARVLRRLVPERYRECVLDSDLVEAACNPHSPTFRASGLAKVQVLHRAAHLGNAAFQFGEREIGRERISVDFNPGTGAARQPAAAQPA